MCERCTFSNVTGLWNRRVFLHNLRFYQAIWGAERKRTQLGRICEQPNRRFLYGEWLGASLRQMISQVSLCIKPYGGTPHRVP